MAPLSCNPEDTNSWANTAQTLPTQPWSLVGLAARRLRRTPACPPRPLCLLDATRVVPENGADRYHKACEEEMAIVQEAHASVHRLTILPDDEDRMSVERLCRAEEAELMAALGHYENGRGKPSGVRPPRAAALTVLVEPAYNTHEKKHAALVLDAAAFLARVGDSDGERLVSSVRVSALFRDHARKYQAEHPSSSMKPVRGQVSVCLSWVVEDPTCFEYEHGGYMESSHAEIAQCDTAKAYVEAIRNAAASLMPECTRATSLGCRALAALSRSVDLARSPVENAHDASVVECDREFWAHVRRAMPALASTAVKRTNEGEHPLDWFDGGGTHCSTGVCLKLVPRPPQGAPPPPLTSEHVYHGLLLHKRGQVDEVYTYCAKETAKERQGKDPNAPWGLPIPSTAPDSWLGLHVLSIRSEWACIADHLSAYGVGGAPGTCPTTDQFGYVLRLVFNLVPFDAHFAEGTFALPCRIGQIWPFSDALPLMEATDAAFLSYKSIFQNGTENESEAEGAPVPSGFRIARLDRPGVPEDHALASSCGVPFGCGAFRIGDVHERLTQSDYPAPHLDGFLRTAISQLDRDQPLSAAFALLADKCKDNERLRGEKRALESRISELEGQLASATAEAPGAPDGDDGSPKRAKNGPVDKSPATECAWDELWPLLRRVGAIEKDSVTLEAPIEKGKLLALLLAIQRARGWSQEAMDVAKAKAKAIKKAGLLKESHDSTERIKRVLETEARFPDSDQLVFVEQRLGTAQFHWVTDVDDQEGVRWGLIPLDDLEESFPDKPVCILVFNETTEELTPWHRPVRA